MTYPYPIPDPQHPSENTVCSLCNCFWRLTTDGEQLKDEWCSEPDGGCRCHADSFANAFLNEMDRYDREAKARRNPVIVEGEEVLGYIGFSSFRDDVA